MGPGGIATIIAACSLLVIAVAISYAVLRVGRFVDEAKLSLKSLIYQRFLLFYLIRMLPYSML